MLSVEILVQAVEVLGFVPEEQRRGLFLPCRVAAGKEVGMLHRVAHLDPHGFVPAVRDRGQVRVDGRPELGDGLGERVGEVAVLAAAEAVPSHDNPAAKPLLLMVDRGDRPAFLRIQQALDHCTSAGVQVGGHTAPVHGRLWHCLRPGAHATSRSSSARFRSTPQR